jgi:transposase
MIAQEQRETVVTLHGLGKAKKEIARLLDIDVKTVKSIVKNGCGAQPKPRSDKIVLDEPLLRDVFTRCEGYVQRVHEILSEEYGIQVGYSTLTQRVREIGLGDNASSRSYHVDDVAGDEMQHDTSLYKVKIGGKETPVICSGLYLRYSKMRYIRFYRRFNRFTMKCFMDEALRFFGYCAKICVIDNTSLAIWYGTGPRAVFAPEMVNFSKNYGFEWKAHEVGHSDRKAGKERNFWTVETNFLPGRTFADIEDLNAQAFEWATQRYAKRPQSKTGLIPIQTFEAEKPYLVKLPHYVSFPCLEHHRRLDDYGYAAFDGNYYWAPEYTKDAQKIREVKIIEYAKTLVLFYKNTEPLRYSLPKDGVRNERFTPDGVKPAYQPRNRKKTSDEEEKALRSIGRLVSDYVDLVKAKDSGIHYPHHFLRTLYLLLRKMAPPLLEQTMARALKYRVNTIEAITRIAAACLRPNTGEPPELEISQDYMEREAYHKGRFCDEPGLDTLNTLFKRSENEPQNPGKE